MSCASSRRKSLVVFFKLLVFVAIYFGRPGKCVPMEESRSFTEVPSFGRISQLRTSSYETTNGTNMFNKYDFLNLKIETTPNITDSEKFKLSGKYKIIKTSATKQKRDAAELQRTKILGGITAERNEFPFQILIRNSSGVYCGGSILDKNSILTAAHCFYGYEAEDYKSWTIVAGDHNWQENDGTEQRRGIGGVHIHKRYVPTSGINDLAIITLDRPLQLSKVVQPILLPAADYEASGNAVVTGWGVLRFGGSQPSVLKKLRVPIVAREDCVKAYEREQDFVSIFMLCAGDVLEGGVDACQGDSGGPLSVRLSNGSFILIGVVSSGIGCARREYPGIYMKVSKYLDWIRETLSSFECRNEKHRPQLHFTPKANWISAPNKLVYYDGEYHLYYQYNPYDTQWGRMHWGHAVSTDLAKWTELDIVLYPDDLGTIFCGSSIIDYNNVTGFQREANVHPLVAFFTQDGITRQQSMAYSLDKGRTFTKYEGNPIISNNIPRHFSDPKVFQYNDGTWVMVLVLSDRVEFWTSSNLKTWEKKSEFGGDPPQGSHDGGWDNPDLIRMVDSHGGYESWVLSTRVNPGGLNGGTGTQYFLGKFDGEKFHSDQKEALWLDAGFDNAVGATFSNEPKNRSIFMGWMSNENYAGVIPTGVYRGQLTLPRSLSLAIVDGRLRLKSVIPEEFFNSLRNPEQFFTVPSNTVIRPNEQLNLVDTMPFSNSLLEVDLVFNIGEIRGCSAIVICFLNSFEQELCVGYDHERPAAHEIFLNREKTGNLGDISGSFAAAGRATSERGTMDKIITFKIILDVSAVELFVDGGLTVMEALFFPDEPLTRIEIRHHASTSESKVTLVSGSVWGLSSMYNC